MKTKTTEIESIHLSQAEFDQYTNHKDGVKFRRKVWNKATDMAAKNGMAVDVCSPSGNCIDTVTPDGRAIPAPGRILTPNQANEPKGKKCECDHLRINHFNNNVGKGDGCVLCPCTGYEERK